MKTVGRFEFPTPGVAEECKEWQPQVFVRALDSRVLCVAKTRIEGAWSAYCGAVPGRNHVLEKEEVLRHGGKLLEDVARTLFPWFEGVPYAH